MRFPFVAAVTLAMTSTALAAGTQSSALDQLGAALAASRAGNGTLTATSFTGVLRDLQRVNATFAGMMSVVMALATNSKLTNARVMVHKAEAALQQDICNIVSQANSTGNTAIKALAATAQTGVSAVHHAANSIGQDLVTNNNPSVQDEHDIAVGIKTARDAVQNMNASTPASDPALKSLIANAQQNVQNLQNNAMVVLTTSGRNLSDIGLPDDFATS